jgi:SAM-dependent methyltransferase
MMIAHETDDLQARIGSAVLLPSELELAVQEFNSSMQRIECELDRGQLGSAHALALVSQCADALLGALEDYSRGDDDADDAVRRRTAKWFMRSGFHARAREKPRGYAGDYYTIEMLYDAKPSGTGQLGLLLDSWALQLPAAQAVRNRRTILVDKLGAFAKDIDALTPCRITSLGSGPAREIIDLLSKNQTRSLCATCIDIDAEALTYAARLAAAAGAAERVKFVRENVIKLALGRGREHVPPQDVIYSVGLFDYLPDNAAVAVLNWMHTHLTPGGTVIVGNVQPGNPTRTYMDTLLDWKLIHRSAGQLRRIFARSHFGEAAVQVECESAGVQLFATAMRNA